MKKNLIMALFIVFVLLVTSVSVLQANTPRSILTEEDHVVTDGGAETQDGQRIEKLQWYSPDGELPGTYQDYLQCHPLVPARFSTPITSPITLFSGNASLAVLVNQSIYPSIAQSLSLYRSDLELEGYRVYIQQVAGGTPEEIKSWVYDRYLDGASGILFIGDITAAWAEVSGDQFPSDLFYMDLDGSWWDNNTDGVYEVHIAGSGDMGPEVYVGRIYASTLVYDSEVNMINQYFEKTHAYRIGELTEPWRGLEYVEEDWFDMDVNLDSIYGSNVTRHDYGFFTTAADYLNQMDLGQHFVQVCVHSYSGGHYFSTRPTESAVYAHVYVHSPTERPAKLLLGSDDGIKAWVNGVNVLTKDRYGGWVPDQFIVNITLESGWNQLLCKISQDGGDYRFSAQIRDMNDESFPDLSYQISDPATHNVEAGYIRSFLLNGFHQDNSENFWNYLTTNYLGVDEDAINPVEGELMGGKTWTYYTSGNPYIDMAEYCGDADYGVCYAFARVYSAEEASCQLWMGHDDGARVWLNGDEVAFVNRYGGFEPDMTKVNVTLHAGENRLLVKISEWMGDHGFSARFCTPDGGAIANLSYDPVAEPPTYLGLWLMNGVYVNPDKQTRLSTDYLGDEGNVTPSQNDSAAYGVWERGITNGYPFNLGGFFDHGDWVFSDDIQERDPPVLFYNLFACGPGRFTDQQYLAGSYIFHTTNGLITIASSKSGSMLNFRDFTEPLGQGKSIGESFRLWFDAQAPYVQWEKEWYYGMVLCGDPTLSIPTAMQMTVTKPENAVYLFDKKIVPFLVPLSFGRMTIEATVMCHDCGIEKVEFLVDGALCCTDVAEPYSWTWDTFAFLRHTVEVVAYDTMGRSTSQSFVVWKFF
jgi:hypothetical protein